MRQIFFIFFFILSSAAIAQKRVTVVADGLFSFDPISSRYVVRSLSPVVTYVEAWRDAGQQVEVAVVDSLGFGYRYYCQFVDTTLKERVLAYLQATLTVDTTLQPIDLGGFPQSRAFTEAFDSDIEHIKRFFATPIRIFDTALIYDPYRPSDFMALFHTFQIEASGADISIFAPPVRDAMLPKECYIRHVVNLLRYDNDLVVVRLSGRQIRELLETSYARRYYNVKDQSSDLLRIYTPSYLYSSIAPTSHTVNLTKAEGRRVENWSLDDDTIYSVALNSFLARDMEVAERVGDYKTMIINWLIDTKDPFAVREKYVLQPARVVGEIVERERKTIFGK